MKSFVGLFQTSSGEFEVNRVVGALGGIAYIIGAHVFVAWELAMGRGFDLTAYCLAFPGGLATLGVGTGAAVAIKDRNVASSKIIEKTGAVPAKPPAGPKVPPVNEEPLGSHPRNGDRG